MPILSDRRWPAVGIKNVVGLAALTLVTGACRDIATPDRTPSAVGPRMADARSSKPTRVVPAQYIVTFNADVSDASDLAKTLVRAHGGKLRHEYTNALHGFSATLPDSAVSALEHNPNVAAIEPDALVDVEGQESPVPSWGLDRIDQTKNRLDSKYNYVSVAGAGVNVYIVDSGVRTTHADFGGRASEAFTTVSDGLGATDCIGHGTHVAGTVGGTAYGVAKNVRLFSVRVIPCSGSAPMSDLIAGLDWIAQNGKLPAVVNISLTGEYSDAANQAVASLVAGGIVVVAAAGNGFTDACTSSPGSASDALTVGASNAADMQAGFSNYGPCVDLFAPGTVITSDYFGTDTSTATMSGTSMATPHVSGAAALYLSLNPTATPLQVTSAILQTATHGVLTNLGAGSPNLLLYTGALASWAPTQNPTPTPTPTPTSSPPTASFTATCSKESCTFDAGSSTDGVGIASYAWDFGDGTPTANGTSATANHGYSAPSAYTVVLTITDTAGRVAKTSKQIRTKRT